MSVSAQTLELSPPQPEPVVRAVAAILPARPGATEDPWWRAGLEEALAAGGVQVVAVPLRRSRGATRA